jgi:methionyl-tRNA formyltransferase
MSDRPPAAGRIALLCATRRGARFLERLVAIKPDADLTVVSFPEEPGEPPFLEDIRALATRHGARFVETRNVGSEANAALWTTPPDILFAVSWRYMVPSKVFRQATRGSFVFHDSMLPAYRGFAPTVWAMVNGEDHTGATLIEMVDAVDAGAIVDQRRIPIGPEDTIGDVIERVTTAYLEMLETNLCALLNGTAPRRKQDHALATYTCKRVASDGRIDWSASSRTVHDLIRAHTQPYWGAFTTLDGREIRIWEARRIANPPEYVGRVAGRVIESRRGTGATVLCGDGAILITRAQIDGDPVDAAEILNSLGQTLGR